MSIDRSLRNQLHDGLVIPAHPLALDRDRRLDEHRQAALTRYYCHAGAGGIAVGVHTTQFAIRDPKIGLFEPVLQLATTTIREYEQQNGCRLVKVAGVCGLTEQAIKEAGIARILGYDLGLLSLASLRESSTAEMVEHCRSVSEVI